MKLKRNLFQLAFAAFVATLGIGCGGFSGSHSVSPATFLLPGLGQHTPPEAAPEVVQAPSPAVALNSLAAQ